MATTREKVAALMPLVERMHRGHCWIKTTEGPRRLDERLDDFKVAEHVAGRKAYGLCPIAPGESVTRAALLDFDSHKGEVPWPEMLRTARDVAFALEQEGHTPILWRSSGGSGIHLYLLWDAPQDAYSVRAMLADVLGALGLKPGTGGVIARQVEVFPKQDEVPADGYGSMWILPGAGMSEFLGSGAMLTASIWRTSTPVAVRERPPKPERSTTDSPELAVLKSALAAIPNDTDPLDYDLWRNVLFAIHYATDGSDEGLALAHEFSARSAKYDPDFIDNRFWPYAGVTSGEVITERSLFALATQHGWQDLTIVDDFDVVEAPPIEDVPKEKVLKYRFEKVSEFCDRPPPTWLIKGVLPRAELGVVFGESGAGKTFFILDLAMSLARGEAWRGIKVKKVRVAYVVAEGAAGFRNRIKAYAHHNNLPLTALELNVLDAAPNLLDAKEAKAIAAGALACGGADLVVIDTFAQSMPGANENSGEDVGKALTHCKGISRALGGAMVLLVHHSGKDSSKGARGWSGLRAAADMEIEVLASDGRHVAIVTKQKDGEDGAEFGFSLRQVLIDFDADGDDVTSCVLEHTGTTGKDIRRDKGPKGENEKLIFHALSELIGMDGGAVKLHDLKAAVIDQMPFDTKEGKRDTRSFRIDRALESLRSAGRVTINGLDIGLSGGSDEGSSRE